MNKSIKHSVEPRKEDDVMKTIYPYLSYAGAVPFILCVVFLLFDIRQLPFLGTIEEILSVYALVIASFLSGSYWGQHFKTQGSWRCALPILSNIIAIFLWLGFLSLNFQALTIMFIGVFIFFLIIDYRLLKSYLITRQYFQTRCLASIIVILSLITSGFFI